MITSSRIGFGDQLGAQMTTLANLLYLAEKNEQEVVFYQELYNYRRGFQVLEVFTCQNVKLITNNHPIVKLISKNFKRISSVDWKKSMNTTYFRKIRYYFERIELELIRVCHSNFIKVRGISSGVHCNSKLLNLSKEQNYDIEEGFGTYQDWKSIENKVISEFSFKMPVVNRGNEVLQQLDFRGLVPVSVHFRLADYLYLASLNLDFGYYKKALDCFDINKTIFVVFSDEIDKVKKNGLFEEKNVIYMDKRNEAAIDMYLMTKCTGGNIIANSSFSFWGAFLNPSKSKMVVCPKKYFVDDSPVSFNNGNYYPDDWIAL